MNCKTFTSSGKMDQSYSLYIEFKKSDIKQRFMTNKLHELFEIRGGREEIVCGFGIESPLWFSSEKILLLDICLSQ